MKKLLNFFGFKKKTKQQLQPQPITKENDILSWWLENHNFNNTSKLMSELSEGQLKNLLFLMTEEHYRCKSVSGGDWRYEARMHFQAQKLEKQIQAILNQLEKKC